MVGLRLGVSPLMVVMPLPLLIARVGFGGWDGGREEIGRVVARGRDVAAIVVVGQIEDVEVWGLIVRHGAEQDRGRLENYLVGLGLRSW